MKDTVVRFVVASNGADGKKVGDWTGPWKTQYPWEIGSPISVDQEEISSEKDNA
jgi:hypothetical protein